MNPGMVEQRNLKRAEWLTSKRGRQATYVVFVTAAVGALVLGASAATPSTSTAGTLLFIASVSAGVIFGARWGAAAALVVTSGVLLRRMLDAPPTGTPLALVVAFVVVMSGVALLAGTVVAMMKSALAAGRATSVQLRASQQRREVIERIAVVGSNLSVGRDSHAAIGQSIEDLTVALGLDVFIVRRNVDRDGELHSEVESWNFHPDHPESEQHRAGTWAWSELPAMRAKLETGQVYVFSSFDEVPEPDRQRLAGERSTLPAVLNVPITSPHGWLGHVALGCAKPGREWTAEDIASLRILADMVANMWDHERNTARLVEAMIAKDRSIATQTALIEGTRLLLGNVEGDPVEQTLGALMDALDGDVSWVERFEEDPIRGWISVPQQHLYRYPERAEPSATWELSSSPIAAQALLSGIPYIFRTLVEEQADSDRDEPYDEPLHAECNIPIVTAGTVVGFVGVGCYESRDWTDSDIDVLLSLARMLGAYLEREQRVQELEDLVTAKDRFIAAVSHELRTPLSVVVGLAAEMEENRESFAREEQTEFLGMIRRQSREVSDIIDDLLVSARLSETALTVIERPFSLDQLVRQVLDDLPPTLTEKITSVDLAEARVLADPLRTRQVVRNLITNAERYGGDNVYIEIVAAGEVSELRVSDDGAGVPESKRSAIFEAYHTTGVERTVTAAIGLGLTVSRQLAQLMGGDVEYVHGAKPCFVLSLRTDNHHATAPSQGTQAHV